MAKRKYPPPMTAAEHQRLLEADPKWVAMREEQERKSREHEARFRAEERPLVDDLVAAGVDVSSVDDLVRTKKPYPKAIPVLLKHFHRSYSDIVRECIVRALNVKESRGVVPPRLLLDEFKRLQDTDENSVKALIAYTMVRLVDDSHFSEIVELVRDRSHGKARWALPLALTWMKERREEAIDVLIELLDDEWVGVQNSAIEALGFLKDEKAVPHLKCFLDHPDSYVRNLAKRALAKIEREISKKSR